MEDPTSFKLKLPHQDLTELRLFRPDSDSAASWVQKLPVGNSAAVVRMLDEALDDLNRTVLSPEIRYSILETLLPSVETALANLAKRFLNQPLVIPPEPRRMAETSAGLISATTTAYTIVAIEAIQRRDSMSSANPARLTCEALQRALLFAGRKILQSYQLHQPMEPYSWEILHQLYSLAEFQHLTDLPVSESRSGGRTIKATYSQALILSCCKPNQLRQGELSALHRGLQQWGEMVRIESREYGDEFFLVDLDSDQPAHYRALYREHLTSGCRSIDTESILQHLKALKDEVIAQGASFDKRSSLSITTLDHLIASLGSVSLRNFKRTASNSPLWICVGLGSTHYRVARQQLMKQIQGGDRYVPAPTGGIQGQPFPLSRGKPDQENPGQYYNQSPGAASEPDVDLDAATRARLLPEERVNMPTEEKHPVFKVQLANSSANGYCLEWIDEMPAEIRTGDIVGLKEDKEDNDWSIAVIRWLSRLSDERTLVGLELLSPRAIAYGGSIHRKGGEKSPPVRVLFLPEIKIVGQPNTLITPRAGFKERQRVTLRNNTQTHTVQLLRQISSTGGFEQFEFRYIKELGDRLAENQSGQMSGEYDSLWSNI